MSLRARYDKLLASAVARLVTTTGKTVGMRLKLYDIDEDKFLYFDFSISIIKDEAIRSFLKSNLDSFETLPLCKEVTRQVQKDGVPTIEVYSLTQEEYDKGLIVSEFENESEARGYLLYMMEIFKWKSASPLEY